jgi:2-iminoacetate synthase
MKTQSTNLKSEIPDSRLEGSVDSILATLRLDRDRSQWGQRLQQATSQEVEAALASRPGSYSLTKLLALVSPPAEAYLEQMATLSQRLTLQRFGRTIRLYVPLYLSSYCINRCRYCGFNRDNTFERVRLSVDEALAEADILAAEGFRDLLLVSSEDRTFITVEYLVELARRLKDKFCFLNVEIYQMSAGPYRQLFDAGIDGVTLYQETYDRDAYARYHPGGPKADYETRLRGPDDMARAGMREIGLGALLGLADWRVETLALAEHASYLMRRYWQSHISFSFPRLRPAWGNSEFQISNSRFRVSDRNLVQMMLALRLCFADAGISLSTREPAPLRDRLMGLGVTRLSAGSRTSPGGYSDAGANTGQFEVSDHRSPGEVSAVIRAQGLDPVWKDWDKAIME